MYIYIYICIYVCIQIISCSVLAGMLEVLVPQAQPLFQTSHLLQGLVTCCVSIASLSRLSLSPLAPEKIAGGKELVPIWSRCSTHEGSSFVRSHEKRRWLFEEPTQSQISTSILKYTTTNLLQIWRK